MLRPLNAETRTPNAESKTARKWNRNRKVASMAIDDRKSIDQELLTEYALPAKVATRGPNKPRRALVDARCVFYGLI